MTAHEPRNVGLDFRFTDLNPSEQLPVLQIDRKRMLGKACGMLRKPRAIAESHGIASA